MIDIGWFANPIFDLYSEAPVRLNRQELWPSGAFSFCPAIENGPGEMWVIRSPLDFELKIENDEIIYVDGTLSADEFMRHAIVNSDENHHFGDTTILQIPFGNTFVSDIRDVYVETFPPFLHYDQIKKQPVRWIVGSFDIYSWPRPVNLAFEWMDKSERIIIKAGDPLQYVRFRSRRPTEKFNVYPLDVEERNYVLDQQRVMFDANRTLKPGFSKNENWLSWGRNRRENLCPYGYMKTVSGNIKKWLKL